jgi:hypothetical protein
MFFVDACSELLESWVIGTGVALGAFSGMNCQNLS